VTPDWYDLLDVPRDADKETIRAAWKAAIADLDPTDRTFRVYSQAGEVLLDDERRAAYDAQLDAEAPDEAPEGVDQEAAAGAPVEDLPVAEADVETAPDVGPAPDEELAPDETPDASGQPAGATAAASARRTVPGWLLLGLGLLAVLVAAAATVMHVTAPNDPNLRSVLGEVAWWDDGATTAGDRTVPPAAEGAVEAAEAAVVPVTAYDYRRLDESKAAAHEVITEEYAEKYDRLYEGSIRDNARELQAVVSVSEVRASALGRVGDGFAEVLLFFDREVSNKARSQPVVYEDQATFRMQKVDGRWLVQDIITTPTSE